MKQSALFIGACGYRYSVKGGEIAKCRVIDRYLHERYNTRTIDTYWEKKNFLYGLWKYTAGRLIKLLRILYWGKISDKIVICSSYATYLKLLKRIRCLKKTHLFGVGGRVPEILLAGISNVSLINDLAGIYVESEAMVSDFLSKGIYNVKYVPNCKYLPRYEKSYFSKDKELKLFFIGKICEEKGCLDIVQAVNELNKEGIDCSLYLYGVVGQGFPIDSIISEKTTYKGYLDLVDDISAYEKLRAYDIFVFPTKWEGEGFAGALIDAMTLGKPIIASRHNNNPDIVKDGETGLLFTTGDVEDLKEKIKFFFDNRDQIEVFGERALKSSNKYDVRYVMNNLFGGSDEVN